MIDIHRTIPGIIAAGKSQVAKATDDQRVHLVGVVAHAMLVREQWQTVDDATCDKIACRSVAIADRLIARMNQR